MNTTTKPTEAASATPATEAPAVYRGPDRRSGEDRRNGSDRRGTGTSPAPEVLEQRCGEQRRGGGDRRNPLREALYRAGNGTYDASYKLAFELVPLLAVTEFAARAQHVLAAFEFRAQHDKALMDRLNGIDPEWRVATDDALTVLHIAQCAGMARLMAGRLADSLEEMSEQAYAASQDKVEGGSHA